MSLLYPKIEDVNYSALHLTARVCMRSTFPNRPSSSPLTGGVSRKPFVLSGFHLTAAVFALSNLVSLLVRLIDHP